ncbi:hypothetical protein HanRHA438_Chr09g0403311 [Helianthus annuus]|nr:hypothetical protein HanRHA438_Chr09g0403311 [Helianthus annuus]
MLRMNVWELNLESGDRIQDCYKKGSELAEIISVINELSLDVIPHCSSIGEVIYLTNDMVM